MKGKIAMERYSKEALEHHLKQKNWWNAWSVLQKLIEKDEISKAEAKDYEKRVDAIQKSKGWNKNALAAD